MRDSLSCYKRIEQKTVPALSDCDVLDTNNDTNFKATMLKSYYDRNTSQPLPQIKLLLRLTDTSHKHHNNTAAQRDN